MKNHELLDIIGEVNEDYVLEAGDNAARPRFGWKTWAVAAACAALVAAVYPAYQTPDHTKPLEQNATAPLHAYTVVEGGGLNGTMSDNTTTGGSEKAPVPDPNAPGGGGDPVEQDESVEDQNDACYDAPGQDAPSQETAIAQYQGLLRGMGGQGGDLPLEPETYPDWFAGSWIDNSCYPEAKLAVAIVDGLRTPELESQIEGWCGGEVLFRDARYSLEHLRGLMDPAVKSLDGTGLSCGIGVNEEENCLGMDIYSLSGDSIPDRVLRELAMLDPSGDAIRVQLFIGSLSFADDAEKGPAPVPGGAQSAEELPEEEETEQPANYDLLPHDE